MIKNFAATLHRDEQVTRSERHLRDMVRELIADAVAAGDVRDDVPPDELATYCLHSITAAGVSRPRLRSIGSSQ